MSSPDSQNSRDVYVTEPIEDIITDDDLEKYRKDVEMFHSIYTVRDVWRTSGMTQKAFAEACGWTLYNYRYMCNRPLSDFRLTDLQKFANAVGAELFCSLKYDSISVDIAPKLTKPSNDVKLVPVKEREQKRVVKQEED